MQRTEIETALDTHSLWVEMPHGKEWRVRRNGQTKLWKRTPDKFIIPVKAGFRSCGRITEDTFIVVHPNNPNQLLIKRI